MNEILSLIGFAFLLAYYPSMLVRLYKTRDVESLPLHAYVTLTLGLAILTYTSWAGAAYWPFIVGNALNTILAGWIAVLCHIWKKPQLVYMNQTGQVGYAAIDFGRGPDRHHVEFLDACLNGMVENTSVISPEILNEIRRSVAENNTKIGQSLPAIYGAISHPPKTTGPKFEPGSNDDDLTRGC